jgi:hypothetical protein
VLRAAEGGMTRDTTPETAPYTLVIEDRCAPEILERVIREAQPFLERAAARIAADFPAARPDLIQEAHVMLWQLDLGRFPQSMARYLARMLRNRMRDVYEIECRHGLTTGRSKRQKSRGSQAPNRSESLKDFNAAEHNP